MQALAEESSGGAGGFLCFLEEIYFETACVYSYVERSRCAEPVSG
jgi:hypothetical protein